MNHHVFLAVPLVIECGDEKLSIYVDDFLLNPIDYIYIYIYIISKPLLIWRL